MAGKRCWVSWRTSLWAVLTLVGVVVVVAACFAGDVAIGLAATYRRRAHFIRPFQYTDMVLFLGYRVFSRYPDPRWTRALRILSRWLWIPFMFVRVLAGAAVLMLSPTRLPGAWIALIAVLVTVLPFAAGYGAWVAGRGLSGVSGRPARVLGIPLSGRTLL
jgi:hypothetical protein